MCSLKYSDESFGGQRFGRWLVLHRTNDGSAKHDRWMCRCDCGNAKDVLGKSLRNGGSVSCGCLRRELNTKRYSAKLVGHKQDWIEVLKQVPRNGRHAGSWWLCKCHRCGNEFETRRTNITNHKIRSCGCEGADLAAERARKRVGPLNNLYNPDLTDADRKPRNDPRVGTWRKAVWVRDGHTCAVTGKAGTRKDKISAHHLNSWDKHPAERFDVDNGITVLWSAHVLFHALFGRGDNTQEQWAVFERQAWLGDYAAI